LAGRRSDGLARLLRRAAGVSGESGCSGLAGTTGLTGGTGGSGGTGQTAGLTRASCLGILTSSYSEVVSRLTGSSVGVGKGLQMVDLRPDILGRSLAEGDLVAHGSLDMVHVVVDEREGDADRDDCHYRESYSRIGHEPIGLDPGFQIHPDKIVI
ncbi:hypothetical protein PMAYCL1PPCAC_31027, partial [Pristionchus mayeri]